MYRLKVMTMIFCATLATLAFTLGVKADDWSKRTKVTFSAPVEIPGVGAQVLPAGTYIIKLFNSQSDRNIVQIFNESQTHVYATILAIPNYRLRATGKTVMTFRERAAGSPQALRAWFYPGDNWGQEFVYPKARAVEIARMTNEPVLAMPTELAENTAAPVTSPDEAPVVALKEAPITAVKPTGEEVAVTEVVEHPPAKSEAYQEPEVASLPHTASSLPLIALIGLLSLSAAFTLMVIQKRSGSDLS